MHACLLLSVWHRLWYVVVPIAIIIIINIIFDRWYCVIVCAHACAFCAARICSANLARAAIVSQSAVCARCINQIIL